MRAIIIDDERWICQLIAKIIDWDKIGIELAGQAEDGLAALELIQMIKPEIVITDIRMPQIDGLEIIRRTREMGIDTSFIIISGFKHFEYAQQAMQYGVEDYLLKPIKKTELTNILVKISKKVTVKQVRDIEEIRLKNDLAHSHNRLREQFIKKLFLDAASAYNLEEINEQYHFEFKEEAYNTVIFQLDEKGAGFIDDAYQRVCVEKIGEVIDAYIKRVTHDYQIVGSYACVYNYSLSNQAEIKNALKNMFEELAKFLGITDCYALTMGVGGEVFSFNEIARSNQEAEDAVRCRITEGQNRIIFYPSLKYENHTLDELFPDKAERQFINTIETLDSLKLRQNIHAIFDNFSLKDRLNPIRYFDLAQKLIRLFAETMHAIDSKNKMRNVSGIDLLGCWSIAGIRDTVSDRLEAELEEYLKLYKTQISAPVRFAVKYICENFDQSIGLEQIAELVNLSPVYLSITFKKDMGMNFSDYIINYRIDVAKKLLKDIQYNISQVSEMVGYSDPKHFSKLFKKRVGINPIEYRKIHL